MSCCESPSTQPFMDSDNDPAMTTTIGDGDAWLCDIVFNEATLPQLSMQDQTELLLSLCTSEGELGGAALFFAHSTEAASTLGPDNFLTCLNPQEQDTQLTLFEVANTTELEE